MRTYGLRSSAAALFLILASSSYAATYAVNSTGDAGDGVCDASCTLRDAIIAANTGSGQDTIDFSDITAAVPVTIALASGPLLITESVIMDASITETRVLPGNPTRRPGVELTGSGSGPGLVLIGGGASYSEIRGMVINNFEEGIFIDTSDHNTIAGNYFGSTVDGVENDGTLVNGVLVFESNNTMIGGSGANDRNIFLDSGENGTAAVGFLNFGFNGNNTTTNDNQVINNYFSLNVVGETAPDLGPPFVSWFDAVSFQMRPVGSSCSNCTMSGNKILHNRIKHIIFGINYASHVPIIDNPNPGENIKIAHNIVAPSNDFPNTGIIVGGPFRNMEISDNVVINALIGMNLTIDSRGGVLKGLQDSIVYGNYVGVDRDGNPGPIGAIGVRVFSAFNLLIGDNAVANAGTGIYLREPSQDLIPGKQTPESVSILANSVYNNEFLGIDLFETGNQVDGVTLNDGPGSLDADFGANNLQNYPVLDWAKEWQGMLRVHGHLNSEASSSYRIDFYANPVAHPSGHGEGKHHLGSFEIETNGGGNSVLDSEKEEGFEVMIDPNSPYITATATKIENPETDCDVDELTQDDRNQCLLDKYGDTSEFSLAIQIQD